MYSNLFIWLSRKLYPNGRVFRMPEPVLSDADYITEDSADIYTDEAGEDYVTEGSPEATGGILYRLHQAIASVQEQTWKDALSILDSAIADNPNFTIDDANLWYTTLGIHNSGIVALADMMLAINQKIYYPGTKIYGRSHFQFIQDQLQAAGFNVFLYENRFLVGGVYVTKTPADILGPSLLVAMHGFVQHGMVQHGQNGAGSGVTKLVNHLEEAKDAGFVIAPNWFSTFYIAGATITTFANVPVARHDEFRQLLLQLKPVTGVGLLFVKYV